MDNINSQNELILDRLLAGEELSVRKAMMSYGIGKFSARMTELKKIYGDMIESRWETAFNRYGKLTRFKVYYMSPETIEQLRRNERAK